MMIMWKKAGATVVGGIVMISLLAGCRGPLYKPGKLKKLKNLAALTQPAIAKPGGSYWQVEKGIELYHFEKGQGTPVLVIHGGPGFPPLAPWKGMAKLEQKYRFIYYHQRGCGRSSKPLNHFASDNFYKNMMMMNDVLGIETHLLDIERIRKMLGQKKLILLGHSFGGFLASLYAAEFPQHVEKLILVAPADVVKMPHKEEGHDGLFGIIEKNLSEKELPDYHRFLKNYFDFKTIFEKDEAQLTELNFNLGRYYKKIFSETKTDVAPFNYTSDESNGWMTFAFYFSMGKKHDYSSALKRINASTLLIHGEVDLIPVSSVSDYKNAIPSLKMETIPDAGHFVFNDQPQKFTETVRFFLK